MTAPRRAAPDQGAIRGGLVLLAAVVIGIALLSKSTGVVASPEAGGANPQGSTTTTATTATTGSPNTLAPTNPPGGQTTHPAKDVSVLVLNASGQRGVAGTNDALVKVAGFTTLPVQNARSAERTTIYFAPGYQADAEAVKRAVKVPAAPVVAAPAEPLVPAAALAKVVVLLGTDYKG